MARIKETADTATLEALVAAAKGKAETAAKSDTRKMGADACFKACKAAQVEHMALLGRVSEAKARDAAKRALAEAKTEAKAGPAEASMAATWIAARTGNDAVDIARSIALAMTLLGIVVTQGAALLAHSAVTLIGSGLRGSQPPTEMPPVIDVVPQSRPRFEAPAPVASASVKLAPPRRYVRLLPRPHRTRASGPRQARHFRELSVFAASIAAGLRKAPVDTSWRGRTERTLPQLVLAGTRR